MIGVAFGLVIAFAIYDGLTRWQIGRTVKRHEEILDRHEAMMTVILIERYSDESGDLH